MVLEVSLAQADASCSGSHVVAVRWCLYRGCCCWLEYPHVLSVCGLDFPIAWGLSSRVNILRQPGVFDLALEVPKHPFLHRDKPSQIQEEGAKTPTLHLPSEGVSPSHCKKYMWVRRDDWSNLRKFILPRTDRRHEFKVSFGRIVKKSWERKDWELLYHFHFVVI